MEYRKLKDLNKLEGNPRIIKDDDFQKLCTSIKANPDYFEARPLILSNRTGQLVIIAGNQRYEAAKHLGLKEVPTYLIEGLTEEREREIIIRDNVNNGQWDWEQLANTWSAEELKEWGVPVWQNEPEIDYSYLDGEDVSEQLANMANGVKKAIQIEFEAEHYEQAFELVKFWRDKGAYVGGMIMEYLKAEKDKA
jgi:hypothetical protein